MMLFLQSLGLRMSDADIPEKLLPAVRVAVFWVGFPFIGLLLGAEDIRGNNYYWAAGWFGCTLLSIAIAVYWSRFVALVKSITPHMRQGSTPSLKTGLYVSDIRLTFTGLTERHSEISMRVFNGTGRVVEFSELSGYVTFNAPNNTDPSYMGRFPTPSVRSDMRKIANPFEEWLVILDQRVPATEADKLAMMFKDEMQIMFDLSGLIISVCYQHDKKIDRLPLWSGVSYRREYGFGRIMSASIGERFGARDSLS